MTGIPGYDRITGILHAGGHVVARVKAHYIGHGEYDEDTGESSLVLERNDRRPQRVGGQQLGALLCGRGSLRLAVLNPSETAQTAPQDPLAGVATSLLEYDVPGVVAMQFAITDDGALTFADEFYRALAEGNPVDASVTQARRALAAHSDVEWGTPVLFLRVADGRLFGVERSTSAHTPKTAQAPRTPRQTSTPTEREPNHVPTTGSADPSPGAGVSEAPARETGWRSHTPAATNAKL